MLIIIHIYVAGLNKTHSFTNYKAKFFILSRSSNYWWEIFLYLFVVIKPCTHIVEGFGKLI